MTCPVYATIHAYTWTSHLLQYIRNTRSFITGHLVGYYTVVTVNLEFLIVACDQVEGELEDKYGAKVVSNLLDVVVQAVNHPQKELILDQVHSFIHSS